LQKETKKVVVIGSLNIDHILRVNNLPHEGETIISESYEIGEGGKGANQAVAIGKLGLPVGIIGKIGKDRSGEMLTESLKRFNVGTDGLIISRYGKTGAAFIMVDKKGNNTIVVAPGSNHELNIKDIKAKEDCLSGADIVVLQMEIPVDTVSYIISRANEEGKTIVLNYAPALEIGKDVLAKVNYLVVNEIEFQALSGNLFKFENLAESINKIREFYKQNLIITLGSKGSAVFNSKDGLIEVPPYTVEAVDSTGAGDAFIGGFILGISKKKPLVYCVKLGNASGAMSVLKPGAQPSLPGRRELRDFLKSNKANETRGI
jgi:ribokinase